MLRFIDFPLDLGASLAPLLAVVGGLAALGLVGVLVLSVVALLTPRTGV